MVSKGMPDCETALTNPMLAVKVGARQWSPVPKTTLFFIASFLVVGRSIIRAEGQSATILQPKCIGQYSFRYWLQGCKLRPFARTNDTEFASTKRTGYDKYDIHKIPVLIQHGSSTLVTIGYEYDSIFYGHENISRIGEQSMFK